MASVWVGEMQENPKSASEMSGFAPRHVVRLTGRVLGTEYSEHHLGSRAILGSESLQQDIHNGKSHAA